MAEGRSWYNYFTYGKGRLLDWTPCKADRKGQTDRRGSTPGGRMLPILRRFPTGRCVRRLERRSLRSSGIIVDRGRAPDGDSTVQSDEEVHEQGRHDAHPPPTGDLEEGGQHDEESHAARDECETLSGPPERVSSRSPAKDAGADEETDALEK